MLPGRARLYAAAAHGRTLSLLLLPPILLNGFMAWVFGRTLKPGRTPLIERASSRCTGQPTMSPPKCLPMPGA